MMIPTTPSLLSEEEEGARPSSPSPWEIASICAASTTVSVGMILLNKALVLDIVRLFGGGGGGLLVLIQNVATVLIVQCIIVLFHHHPEDHGGFLLRLPCALLFGANTFTSIQALSHLSVTAFTILRNTQALVSYPLDYALRGERLRPVSVFCLLVVLLGTCAFCTRDLRANVAGIVWAAAHVLSSALYAVLAKLHTEGDAFRLDPLGSTLEMARSNNLLSLPIIAAATAGQCLLMPQQTGGGASPTTATMLALSCAGGCAMSLVGLRTQALLSPVVCLTFNNLNKIPAMLISAVIWPHLETTDTAQEALGIVLSIYGGFLLAASKQGDVHPFAVFVAVALCAALIPLMVLGERVPLQGGGGGFNHSTNRSV